MKAVILDNNTEDAIRLREILSANFPDIQPQAIIQTPEESASYFQHMEKPDVIFLESQFDNGNALSALSELGIQVPVIFTSNDNKYLQQAFMNNGIDYLLKPLNVCKIQKGILKLRSLREHFAKNQRSNGLPAAYTKKRIVAKKGNAYRLLNCTDVVIFFSASKVSFLLDKNMDKYLTEKNLNFLQSELDSNMFFRANRQYIINVNYIVSFKPIDRIRICVEMAIPEGCENRKIIISQHTAVKFREWIHSF